MVGVLSRATHPILGILVLLALYFRETKRFDTSCESSAKSYFLKRLIKNRMLSAIVFCFTL